MSWLTCLFFAFELVFSFAQHQFQLATASEKGGAFASQHSSLMQLAIGADGEASVVFVASSKERQVFLQLLQQHSPPSVVKAGNL